MSLIVKGMKMPYSCVVCDFKEMMGDCLICKPLNTALPKQLKGRDPKCPLAEVPTSHGGLNLKPCPFCNSKAEILVKANGTGHDCKFLQTILIRCSNSDCKCEIGRNYDHEFYIDNDGSFKVIKDGYAQAAKDWNRRAT